MARKYHTLIVRNEMGSDNDNVWRIAFGDYDRDCVIDEMADTYARQHRSRDMKIVASGDKQTDIDAAVAKWNS